MTSVQHIVETVKGYKNFERIIIQGRQYQEKPIKAFVYVAEADKPEVHVGFTVKKGIKKATERNKIKRQMREAFRLDQEKLLLNIQRNRKLEIIFMFYDINEGKKRFSLISRAISSLCSMINIELNKERERLIE